MHTALWLILFGVAWGVWAVCARTLCRGPRQDPVTGLAWWAIRAYARAVHRLRAEGLHNVPATRDAGPLVLVINHTAGVDPLLVQAFCPFFIRWMMGRDMRARGLGHVWEWADVIDVDRKGRDTTSARRAIRALRDGDIIGIFPEGRIERPRGTLLPFHPGVGMIVAASNAPVLPVFIRGTPDARTAWGSLLKRGHAVVRFGPLMPTTGLAPEEVSTSIRAWFEAQIHARDKTL